MNAPRDGWTWVLVTAVTLLIWSWAASETRDTRRIPMRIKLAVPDEQGWLIEPSTVSATITAEGSARALRQAEAMAQQIRLMLSAEVGPQQIDLKKELEQSPELRQTGITIEAIDQPTWSVKLDTYVTVPIPVQADLPGVQTDGPVSIEPTHVDVTLPNQMRQTFGESMIAVASVPRSELERLTGGRRQQVDQKLTLQPEGLRNQTSIRIQPPSARLAFTIKSQEETFKLPTPVRIELAGPPEDHARYAIEVDPQTVDGVTVKATSEVIRKIREGQARVVAQLRLGSAEKDARKPSKAISCFQAEMLDGSGTVVLLDAKVDGVEGMPEIKLTITPLEEAVPTGSVS